MTCVLFGLVAATAGWCRYVILTTSGRWLGKKNRDIKLSRKI